MTPAPSIVILGGGIAGITAAVHLAQRGVPVALYETRKRLGGRATSLTDPRTGEEIDNCQHVALGCCTAYLDLLRTLRVDHLIRWDRTQTWVEAGGRRTTLTPAPLPAPLHHSPGFLAARFLSLADKLAIARAMAAIALAKRERWTDRTFAQFLAPHGQTASALRRFWEPVVVSACNLPCDRVSAAPALQVFQEGFLASARASEIGVSTVPLARLYDAAEPIITAAGGAMHLGASVRRLSRDQVELATGDVIRASAIISALPFERLLAIADDDLRGADPRLERLAHLRHSPILGVHLRFDRSVLDVPHAVLVDRPTQWLFRKDDRGEAVHAVISAADDWLDLDEDAIVARVTADLHACFPASRDAGLIAARSIKEKRATFAATPEGQRARPSQAPPAPGLPILAGDFTDTGWPATMEGAARSGVIAATLVQ